MTGAAGNGRGDPIRWQLWLCLIVTGAAALRFAVADHSLWFDEQASVFFSDQPFARLWSNWMLRETNPALYYSMLRAWRAVFGSTDFAIRAMSVVASLGAIVIAFNVTRRLYGERAGLIAAALAALSGQQLYFAEQARAYIFILAAVLVAVDALLVFVDADDDARAVRWRSAAVFAVVATACVYLHTTMILFPPIAVAAIVAADPLRYARRPALLMPLIAAGLVILALASWELRIAALQMRDHSDNIAAIGVPDLRQTIKNILQALFLGGYDGKPSYRMILPLLVMLVVLAFVVRGRRRRATRFLALLTVLAVLAFALVGRIAPIFATRTILWVSAATLVLAAGGLASIPAARWRWGALAAIVALLAFDTSCVVPTLEQEDWNTPVRRLAAQPDALLLVQSESMALLADEVCRRRLGREHCPYTIVAMTDPGDHYDTWAWGLFAGPKVDGRALPGYAKGRTVFLFRKAFFHSVPDLLHAYGLGHGVPAFGPPLIGPLPATALR